MLNSLTLKSDDDSSQNSCVETNNCSIEETEFRKLEWWYLEQKTETWLTDKKTTAANEAWQKNNKLNDWYWMSNLKKEKLIFILNAIR